MSNNELVVINNKQEELKKIIIDFSANFIEDFDDYIELLQHIYDDGFRHSYSDITATLIRLDSNDNEAIDKITCNLYTLLDQISEEERNTEDFTFKSISKLHDHIALEQIRLREVYRESKEIVKEAKKQSDAATETLTTAKKLSKESAAIKMEVITILGIFSAILLAFVGGMTFSTSVLANLHLVSIYRLVMAILLIGVVLINVLYGLYYFIYYLVKQSREKTLKPLIIANVIIIILMGSTIIAWYFGLVEARDNKLENKFEIIVNNKN